MEKAVGTAFYHNIPRQYGLVNQPKLIRDEAMKRKVLLILESVIRGIDRLEAVVKTDRSKTSSRLYSRSCRFRRRARLRTSRHCKTLCSGSKKSRGRTHPTQLKRLSKPTGEVCDVDKSLCNL
jgi:hypothetical protein